MSELKSALERLADRAGRSANPLERLSRRRARVQRNRRMLTAALAFVIAAAGVGLTLTALAGWGKDRNLAAQHHKGTYPASALTALWPQYSADQARLAEQRADAGDPAFTWLLDSSSVASRFAEQFLGWKYASVSGELNPVGSGIDHHITIIACAPWQDCPISLSGLGVPRAKVTLAHLGDSKADGIWSVIGVRDDTIAIWAPDGQVLREGAALRANDPLAATAGGGIAVRQGAGIGVGALTDGPCGFVLRSRQATLGDAWTYFGAGADFGSCPSSQSAGSIPGYVLVYSPGRVALSSTARPTEPLRMTALPVLFGPSLGHPTTPTPTDYFIELPAEGLPADGRGLGFDALTDLPEGTIIEALFRAPRSATRMQVMVHDGRIQLGVPNSACSSLVPKPSGAQISWSVRLAPVISSLGCSDLAGYCGTPQPPSVILVLGRHYEFVRNLTTLGVERSYELPGETCR